MLFGDSQIPLASHGLYRQGVGQTTPAAADTGLGCLLTLALPIALIAAGSSLDPRRDCP